MIETTGGFVRKKDCNSGRVCLCFRLKNLRKNGCFSYRKMDCSHGQICFKFTLKIIKTTVGFLSQKGFQLWSDLL